MVCAAAQADRPQQTQLAGPFQHRQRQRVDDAEDGDERSPAPSSICTIVSTRVEDLRSRCSTHSDRVSTLTSGLSASIASICCCSRRRRRPGVSFTNAWDGWPPEVAAVATDHGTTMPLTAAAYGVDADHPRLAGRPRVNCTGHALPDGASAASWRSGRRARSRPAQGRRAAARHVDLEHRAAAPRRRPRPTYVLAADPGRLGRLGRSTAPDARASARTRASDRGSTAGGDRRRLRRREMIRSACICLSTSLRTLVLADVQITRRR